MYFINGPLHALKIENGDYLKLHGAFCILRAPSPGLKAGAHVPAGILSH